MTIPAALALALLLAGGASAQPGFFTREESSGRCVLVPARRFSSAPAIACRKSAGTKRVFLVGNSLVKGLVLPRPFPSVELVSCGLPAYDSAREVPIVRELLSREADLVVVMTGSNDEDDAALERSLEAMIADARAARVPLVLATVPVGLSALPPRLPEPLEEAEYFEARRRGWEGSPERELEGMKSVLERRPQDAHAAYRAGAALLALGRPAEARPYLEAASQRGGPGRMTPARNALIRRVAARAGVAVADIEAAFSSAAPHGLVGLDLMASDDHWRRDRLGLASDALFASPALVSLLGAAPLWAGRPPPPDPMDAPDFQLGAALIEWAENAASRPSARLSERAIARSAYALSGLRDRSADGLWRAALAAARIDPFYARDVRSLRPHRAVMLAHWAEALRRSGDCSASAVLLAAAEASAPAPAPVLWARALHALTSPDPEGRGARASAALRADASRPEARMLDEAVRAAAAARTP